MQTDFRKVYGAFYVSQYQSNHLTRYELHGARSLGTWNIIDFQKGSVSLKFPFVAPDAQSVLFVQIYRLLSELDWESLTGSETDFFFVGEDGSTYALSYALWEEENSHCTKDGAPVDQTFGTDNGYMSHSLFTEMTGLYIREHSNITYQGSDSDGTVQLPSGPGLDLTE